MYRLIHSLRVYSFAALLLLCSVALPSQSNGGTVSGHVTDASGAVLQGARVTLDPGGRSATTNNDGDFTLIDVAAGSYKLQVGYVGFSDYSTDIGVAAGKSQTLKIALKVATQSEEVVVTADRVHGEAEAINRIRTGDNILQVATAEVITSLPNANMADAIGRMPSVTLERDEGEGKYIQVRGTEPRLTNVTINGNTIPSEEGSVRQIKLDAVASDLVESVELNKTLSANQDADGIGGSVNFVTKTAGETPTVSITGLGGYTPIEQGRNVFQYGVTLGRRFGASKKLGILGGGTYDFNGRGIDDIEPSFTGVTYSTLQTREYKYYRSRFGFTGGVDYKLKEGSNLYMKGMYSDFYDYGDKWYYSYIQGKAPKFYTSSRRPEYAVSTVSLGGKHLFGTSSLIWDISASYSWMDAAAGNPKADFAYGPGTKVNYNVDQTTNPARPQFTPINTTLAAIQTPSNWYLLDAQTSSGRAGGLGLSGSIDYQKIHKFGTHFGAFSIGAKVRNLHRGQNAVQAVYDSGTNVAANNMTNFLGSFTNSNYYDGSYILGPVSDFQLIVKSGLPLLKYEAVATLQNSALNNYNLVERISAGYIMEGIDLNKWLHLQAGLRFENTYESGQGFLLRNGVITPTTGVHPYLDPLPSAQLRIAATRNSNLRLVYGRGIARPNPLDLIPYINETDSSTSCPSVTTPVAGQCSGSISQGNPNLKPEYANDYDVLYEHFLNPLGMIQAGFFYKDLSSPIFQTMSVVQYTPPGTSTALPYASTAKTNGRDAHIAGIEVGFQQRLSYLPGALGGLGINANYSYTTSQANGIPYTNTGATTYRSAALLRQSPHSWNISPTYDHDRVSLRAGFQYNSSYIYQYANWNPTDTSVLTGGAGPNGDDNVFEHFQIDTQGSVRLYKGLTFIAYGLNLNNEPFGHFTGAPAYLIQREYYKQTFAFGLKYNLAHER